MDHIAYCSLEIVCTNVVVLHFNFTSGVVTLFRSTNLYLVYFGIKVELDLTCQTCFWFVTLQTATRSLEQNYCQKFFIGNIFLLKCKRHVYFGYKESSHPEFTLQTKAHIWSLIVNLDPE